MPYVFWDASKDYAAVSEQGKRVPDARHGGLGVFPVAFQLQEVFTVCGGSNAWCGSSAVVRDTG